jgi:hypothetical protein
MTEATILTFHEDPKLKEQLLVRIGAHEQADAIAKGAYEKWNGGVKRCAVGCSLRDLAERGDEPEDWHQAMEDILGVPAWLARLEDTVFEHLPDELAKGWPRRFSEAVPVGVSLEGLADRLAVRRLREECLPLAPGWPERVRGQVVAAVEEVVAALESGDADARVKAWSAGSAARSAARSAAWSGWSAARSGARSAESAARSAARSAESAGWSEWSAWGHEAVRIVEELERVAAEAAA